MPATQATKVGICRRGKRSRDRVSEGKKVCRVPTIAAPNQPPRLRAMWAPSRLPWLQADPVASIAPATTPTARNEAAARYQRLAQGALPSERRRIWTKPAAYAPSTATSRPTPRQVASEPRSGTASAIVIAPAFQPTSCSRTSQRAGGSVARKAPAKNWLAPRINCEIPPTKTRCNASHLPQLHGSAASSMATTAPATIIARPARKKAPITSVGRRLPSSSGRGRDRQRRSPGGGAGACTALTRSHRRRRAGSRRPRSHSRRGRDPGAGSARVARRDRSRRGSPR